jgi:hypothetical protein
MKRLKTITGIDGYIWFHIMSKWMTYKERIQIQMLIQQLQNLKRTSMYDGSFDDFIDGASCSSIVLPP